VLQPGVPRGAGAALLDPNILESGLGVPSLDLANNGLGLARTAVLHDHDLEPVGRIRLRNERVQAPAQQRRAAVRGDHDTDGGQIHAFDDCPRRSPEPSGRCPGSPLPRTGPLVRLPNAQRGQGAQH
jgi:hypothetical protein